MKRVVWALSVATVFGFSFLSAPDEADACRRWRGARRCRAPVTCRRYVCQPCAEPCVAKAPRASFEYHHTERGLIAISDKDIAWLWQDGKWNELEPQDTPLQPPFLLKLK